MAFSATDAVFEGFRLARRNPLAILWWGLVYFVVELANLAASGSIMGRMTDLTEMMEGFEASPPTTPEGWMPMFQAYADLMAAMWWLAPLSLLVGAVLSAAAARGVLTPADKAFGYVRLGMDEVRVLVVTVVLSIAIGVIAFVSFMAAGVIGGIAIAAIGGIGALVMILLMFAAMALIIWLSVRWSLAVPITMAQGKMSFFDSFALTKGRFWPLLGMAFLAGILALVIYMLCSIVAMPVGVMSGNNPFSGADPAEIMARMTLTNPWAVLGAAINALSYALVVGICYAPFSSAYLQLTGRDQPAD